MSIRIPLAEATAPQLRAFAKDNLGIGFPFGVKKEAMVAKIQAAWDKPWIEVDGGASPAEAEVEVAESISEAPLTPDEITRGNVPLDPKTGQPVEDPVTVRARLARDAEKVTIIVARSSEKSIDDRILLGCNGRHMLVERGKPQVIPRPYLESLDKAVQHIFDDVEIDGQITRERSEVPLYPYSLIG